MAEDVAARPPANLVVGTVYAATDVDGNLNPDLLAAYPGLATCSPSCRWRTTTSTRSARWSSARSPRPATSPPTTCCSATPPADGRRGGADARIPRRAPGRGSRARHRAAVPHRRVPARVHDLQGDDAGARRHLGPLRPRGRRHRHRDAWLARPERPGGCTLDAGAFFDTANFVRTADRLRQSVTDILSFVRACTTARRSTCCRAGRRRHSDLDVSRLAMAGQSMAPRSSSTRCPSPRWSAPA